MKQVHGNLIDTKLFEGLLGTRKDGFLGATGVALILESRSLSRSGVLSRQTELPDPLLAVAVESSGVELLNIFMLGENVVSLLCLVDAREDRYCAVGDVGWGVWRGHCVALIEGRVWMSAL